MRSAEEILKKQTKHWAGLRRSLLERSLQPSTLNFQRQELQLRDAELWAGPSHAAAAAGSGPIVVNGRCRLLLAVLVLLRRTAKPSGRDSKRQILSLIHGLDL